MSKFLNVVGSLGISLMAGLNGINYVASQNHVTYESQIEQIVRDYPEQPTGVRQVNKYFVDDSKYVLIHVKQNHYTPFLLDDSLKLSVVRCQNDIVDFFKYMEGKENILAEGNPNYIRVVDDAEKDLAKFEMFNEMGVEFANDDVVKQKKEKVDKYHRELEQGRLEDYSKITATDILNYHDEANVYDAEDVEINEKRFDEVMEKGLGEWNEKAEDLVVERAYSLGQEIPVIYTVFGSGHSFRNNVDEWNENNPDEKMSLIEVVPNSVGGE